MHWRAISRLFGILLVLYSLSFLPSIGIALLYDDAQWGVFTDSLIVTAAAGLILWLPNVKQRSELSVREGFLASPCFGSSSVSLVHCHLFSAFILA